MANYPKTRYTKMERDGLRKKGKIERAAKVQYENKEITRTEYDRKIREAEAEYNRQFHKSHKGRIE